MIKIIISNKDFLSLIGQRLPIHDIGVSRELPSGPGCNKYMWYGAIKSTILDVSSGFHFEK